VSADRKFILLAIPIELSLSLPVAIAKGFLLSYDVMFKLEDP
jgi:hypothetical protein